MTGEISRVAGAGYELGDIIFATSIVALRYSYTPDTYALRYQTELFIQLKIMQGFL